MNVLLILRILIEYFYSQIGIDIYLGVKIGLGFCIDYGIGMVIGGISQIGNNVKIYQGVILGVLSVKKELVKIKCYFIIEDNVVIYVGVIIFGGDMIIGYDSIIGGNVWIIKSIVLFFRVYYNGYINQKLDNFGLKVEFNMVVEK